MYSRVYGDLNVWPINQSWEKLDVKIVVVVMIIVTDVVIVMMIVTDGSGFDDPVILNSSYNCPVFDILLRDI